MKNIQIMQKTLNFRIEKYTEDELAALTEREKGCFLYVILQPTPTTKRVVSGYLREFFYEKDREELGVQVKFANNNVYCKVDVNEIYTKPPK